MLKYYSLKKIIRADIRIGMMVVFMWGAMAPISSKLTGILSLTTIGAGIVLTGLSMEFLKVIIKYTTFKSSVKLLIAYDVFFTISTAIINNAMSRESFALYLMISCVPYGILTKASDIKFKTLLGDIYPKYIVERIFTNFTILCNRVGMIATGLITLLSSVGIDGKEIINLFIVGSIFQIYFSIKSFIENYKDLK